MTFNQWRSIKGGSLFDGVNTMCDCWQYGLLLNYVQIPIKRDVIKLKLTVSDVGLTLIKETVLNKLELTHELKIKTKLTEKEAADVVNLFFETIVDALENGDRVEIRGLCSFYVKEYESYIGRNPKTGEQVEIPAKRLPFFKCGKDLRDRVDKKHNKVGRIK